jgi:hypothetical protein
MHKLVKALVEKAEGGDVVAAREIMDRVESKVPQAIAGDPENPNLRIFSPRNPILPRRSHRPCASRTESASNILYIYGQLLPATHVDFAPTHSSL